MRSGCLKQVLSLGMIVIVGSAMLSGCGKEKKVDYDIEKVQQSESLSGKSSLNRLEGEEKWKETWDIVIGESDWNGQMLPSLCEVKVDAQIILPESEKMSVIEVEEPEFNAEFKKRVAERFFSFGEIYYGDAAHLPVKDLRRIQKYFDEGGSINYADYALCWDEIERKMKELREVLDNQESAPANYTSVKEYNVDEYVGIWEGQYYCLNFAVHTGDIRSDYRRLKRITMEVQDLYQICPQRLREVGELTCSPWTQGNWVENECGISREAAFEKAKEFVEQLGLDYPVASTVYPLLWGTPPQYVNEKSDASAWGVNGYIFCFDLGVDDISFVDYGKYGDYRNFWNDNREVNKEIRYGTDCELQVYVTENGIVKMVADNPMEIVGVYEDVKILDFDISKNLVKDATHGLWKYPNAPTYAYDTMELIYFRVRDKQNPGRYSYVPVWRLGTVTRDVVTDKISIIDSVMINAIDGTLIDFYDET